MLLGLMSRMSREKATSETTEALVADVDVPQIDAEVVGGNERLAVVEAGQGVDVVAMGMTEYPFVLRNNVGRRLALLSLGVRSGIQKGTGDPSDVLFTQSPQLDCLV